MYDSYCYYYHYAYYYVTTHCCLLIIHTPVIEQPLTDSSSNDLCVPDNNAMMTLSG